MAEGKENTKGASLRIEDIEKEMKKFLVVADDGAFPLLMATMIANRIKTADKPVWVIFVAPSSGGKTEMIETLLYLTPEYSDKKSRQLCYSISNLTPNTFISGMLGQQKEASLLFRVNNKVLLFKDMTTLVEMNHENRKEIMSQFREVYDGSYSKEHGTGKTPTWTGKVGAIGAITPGGLENLQEHATMGERFINYYVNQPSRESIRKKNKDNFGKDFSNIREKIRTMTARYVLENVQVAEEYSDKYKPDDDVIEQISKVADFATLARSPMRIDPYKKQPVGLPSFEGSTRFTKQLHELTKAFFIMGKGRLVDRYKKVLYKIALDSIPSNRRTALKHLAKYKIVGTKALALEIGLSTEVIRGWLLELASLKLARRKQGAGSSGNEDGWELTADARSFMQEFDGVVYTAKDLLDEDIEDDYDADADDMDDELDRWKNKKRVEKIAEENDDDIDEIKKIEKEAEDLWGDL